MAFNIDIKNLLGVSLHGESLRPPFSKIIMVFSPSIALIILFFVLVYSPKREEIKVFGNDIVRLNSEIASSEVKVKRLDILRMENVMLKAKLRGLQEQLPEEKEVSGLLRQISELGIKSGLKILLWRPEERVPDPSGLYVRIPVKVEVSTSYHNLGSFSSHISRLPRIVNISDIKLTNPVVKEGAQQLNASFIATTFSATPPPAVSEAPKKL